MKKKLISILLALSMMLQMCGMAAAVTTPASGTCGDHLTWSLSADGVLTISGSGDMTDYSSNSQVPWLKDYGFSKIKRVVIGDQVTRIGNWAFYNCVNMTALQLGSSVTEIGSSAFSVCTGLESVEIPASVRTIEDTAFGSCTKLETLTISNGVEKIGDYAFSCCEVLDSVTIPDSVQSIGDYAFMSCYALRSVVIPDSVKTIGAYAFTECWGLESVTIGSEIETIGDYAFAYSGWLAESGAWIEFQGNVPAFLSEYEGEEARTFDESNFIEIRYPANSTEWADLVEKSTDENGESFFCGAMVKWVPVQGTEEPVTRIQNAACVFLDPDKGLKYYENGVELTASKYLPAENGRYPYWSCESDEVSYFEVWQGEKSIASAFWPKAGNYYAYQVRNEDTIFTIKAYDAQKNLLESVTVQTVEDNTAPVISKLNGQIDGTSATIFWEYREPAPVVAVLYFDKNNNGRVDATDAAISNLLPIAGDTTVELNNEAFAAADRAPVLLWCIDPAYNVAVYEVSFAIQDTELPVIAELSATPTAAGGTKADTVNLVVKATDDAGVASITLSYSADDGETDQEIKQETFEAPAKTQDMTCAWDVSKLSSGTYTVKAAATDRAGKTSEAVTTTVVVDNTPPAAPTGFTVAGNSQYIHVAWNRPGSLPDDFSHYEVYRAEDVDGTYTLVQSKNAIGYYDDGTRIDADTTYYYYVAAVDQLSNRAVTDVLSGQMYADQTEPGISDMLPRDNANLRKQTTLQVSATDNYRLKQAEFSYRSGTSGDWNAIGTAEVAGVSNNEIFSLAWNLPEELSGTCQIRTVVSDEAGNTRELIRTVHVVAYTAPAAPVVTVTPGYKTAALSWTYPGDVTALKQFVVYQTNQDGSERTYLSAVKAGSKGSYTAKIPSNGEQYFAVEVQDHYGAVKVSSVIPVVSTADTVPPTASIQTGTLTAAAGVPVSFSGIRSADNDAIADYTWSFGDGNTASGSAVQHTYLQEGTYTVILQVQDPAGNTSTAETKVTVHDVAGEGADYAIVKIWVCNAYEENTPEVKDATVVLSSEKDTFKISGVTDASGCVSFVAPIGTCTVSIAADGYLTASRSITVEPDSLGYYSKMIGLTPANVSVVDGSLTVKEMTYEEIRDAGIDLTDEDNYHVTKMELEVQFTAGPAAPVPLPIEAYFNAAGKLLPDVSDFGWTTVESEEKDDDDGSGESVGPATTKGSETKIGVFPISENFVLVVYGEAHWLKEMYNVELLVINNSYMDDLTDCVATLELPDGLSLADLTTGVQTPAIEVGTVSKKSSETAGANMKTVNWYVCGDSAGEYYLSAALSGMLGETPFVSTFRTSEPVKVYAGDALHLTITADAVTYLAQDYHIQYKLENVSDKTLYNLSFGLTSLEFEKVILGISTEDGSLMEGYKALDEQELTNTQMVSFGSLAPGQYITLDLFYKPLFLDLREFLDLGPFDIGYYANNILVTAMEGSTTAIPYSIEWSTCSYSDFYEWAGKQTGDQVKDIVTHIFTNNLELPEIPVLGAAKKIYEISTKTNDILEDTPDVVITLHDGAVFDTGNNARAVAAATENAVVKVYTDSQNYSISDDGKTITISDDAKVYVEGCSNGTAGMTVKTTATAEVYSVTADGNGVTSSMETRTHTYVLPFAVSGIEDTTGGNSSDKPSGGSGSSGSSGSSTGTTTTQKQEDGSITTTTTDRKSGTVTETTVTPNGVTGTTVTDKNGVVTEISAKVPSAAVKEAEKSGQTVMLPIKVEAAKTPDEATEISVDVPSSGATVEIPVKNVSSGTVAVMVKADGTDEIIQDCTISDAGIIVPLEKDATVKIIDNSKYFEDVHPVNHWATEAIDYVVAREIFGGTTAKTFNPNSPMTRQAMWMVLARMSGEDPADMTEAKAWAMETGISDGSNPLSAVSRQQFITMLWRWAMTQGVDVSVGESTNILSYEDAFSISEYAFSAIQWGCGAGIVNGKTERLLDPAGQATRGQVATFLMRFFEQDMK